MNDIKMNTNRNSHFSSYMLIYYFSPLTLETRALKNNDLTQLMHYQRYKNN